MSNKFVRVVAIVLAVLMAGGVFAAVLQVFAVSPEAAAVAATGQRSYWPVIVALIASCCADCTLHHYPKGVEEKINAPPRMLIRQ